MMRVRHFLVSSVIMLAAFCASAETIPIRGFYWNCPPQKDDAFSYLEQKFNVKLDVVQAPWADKDNVLQTLIAAGDQPDFFQWDGWSNPFRLKTLIDQGVIRSIPENLIPKYDRAKWMYSKIPDQRWTDGNFWFWPKFDNKDDSTKSPTLGFQVRADYMKKLGLSMKPQTWAEFNAILKALTFNDPDGNGKKDTYGITFFHNNQFNAIYPMFGMRDWNFEKGQWIPGLVSTTAKNATRYLRDLYAQGIIDPDYPAYATNPQPPQEAFAKGTVAMYPDSMNPQNNKVARVSLWERLFPKGSDLNQYVGVLSLPAGPTGKKIWPFDGLYVGTVNVFSSKVDDKKLDKIFEIFNWLSTAEGYQRVVFGEQGKDFRIDGNQAVSLMTDKAGKATTYAAVNPWGGRFRQFAIWNNDGVPGLRSPDDKDWDYNAWSVVKDTYMPSCYPRVMWTKYIVDQKVLDFNPRDFAYERLTQMVVKGGDFEADWNKYVADFNKELKASDVIKVINAEAAKKNIKPEDYMAVMY
jgi:putative aldouronate transport system substrate-binding protein